MGTSRVVDSYRLAQVLDVVSWDGYPEWTGTDKDIESGIIFSFSNDINRSLKGKPFMLMETSPMATNWHQVTKLHRPNVHMLQSMLAVAHGSDTVQYFQFRKSRGCAEKFHGAVVDHEGSENTRVFRDVAEVGKRLAGMDAVVGTVTPAEIALVYDWQNCWALDDVRGFLQNKTAYTNTVMRHYSSFWKQGLPVDVIDSSLIAKPNNLDKYRMLVAPMLYMLRPGVAEAIDAFVQKGGTFVATYISGQVDESDLTFLGGFPGPLRETLGIWCEEVDALYPEECNSINWNGKSYKAFDLCELIHAEGAQVLGTYGAEFYAGQPAFTVNARGKGKAYFIAARTDSNFLDDCYRTIADEAGVRRIVETLPHGVTAQIRSDGKTDFIFLLNCTPKPAHVDLGQQGIKNLAPYECLLEVIDEQNHR
jgi:beta-galactosidase